MNWKSVMVSVISVVIALIVWEMFVKKLVLKSAYEGEMFDYQPGENEGYKRLRKVA